MNRAMAKTRPQWESDLDNSVCDFKRVVWPSLKKMHPLKNGTIFSVENSNDPDIQSLDRDGGLDIIVNLSDGAQTSIAGRVQWIGTSKINNHKGSGFDTFSIRFWKPGVRHNTEYKKRMDAIDSGYKIYPLFTSQAYVYEPSRKGPLVSVALIKTTDLYEFIKKYDINKGNVSDSEYIESSNEYVENRINPSDRVRFKAVGWDTLEKNGYDIKIFRNTEETRQWTQTKLMMRARRMSKSRKS